jgi:hypothetical protein
MRGWTEESAGRGSRLWRDTDGDVLSLTLFDTDLGLPGFSNQSELQQFSRRFASSRGAGLIEMKVANGSLGPTLSLIFKQLEKPSYIFTGMLLVPNQSSPQIWSLVATERGTTGLREAVVTAQLFSAGKLTIENYDRSWAQDPYDPSYREVDQSLLRFVSDDASYDEKFPQHPLSKVRRILATLPNFVHMVSATGFTDSEG